MTKPKVRRIKVAPWDVLGEGVFTVVVLDVPKDGGSHARATCVSMSLRLTKIQVVRLQREYPRLGEINAAKLHRELLRKLEQVRPAWAVRMGLLEEKPSAKPRRAAKRGK